MGVRIDIIIDRPESEESQFKCLVGVAETIRRAVDGPDELPSVLLARALIYTLLSAGVPMSRLQECIFDLVGEVAETVNLIIANDDGEIEAEIVKVPRVKQ
jgi:hypothetical protein